MGEFVYCEPGKDYGFSPEIMDVIQAESISLFDVEQGSLISLDLSFDEDGGTRGKIVFLVDRPATRESWDRGAFTVVEAELGFESTIGELVGRTGSFDAAIDYRPGTSRPIGLAKIAHIDKGRSLIINFDIPEMPDRVNRWIPVVLDMRLNHPINT